MWICIGLLLLLGLVAISSSSSTSFSFPFYDLGCTVCSGYHLFLRRPTFGWPLGLYNSKWFGEDILLNSFEMVPPIDFVLILFFLLKIYKISVLCCYNFYLQIYSPIYNRVSWTLTPTFLEEQNCFRKGQQCADYIIIIKRITFYFIKCYVQPYQDNFILFCYVVLLSKFTLCYESMFLPPHCIIYSNAWLPQFHKNCAILFNETKSFFLQIINCWGAVMATAQSSMR